MSTTAQMTRHRSGTLGRLEHEKPIALRLLPAERQEALNTADAEGRSASNFARLIYLMGMEQYKQRGRIELAPATVAKVCEAPALGA
jgi:hypothetical protein